MSEKMQAQQQEARKVAAAQKKATAAQQKVTTAEPTRRETRNGPSVDSGAENTSSSAPEPKRRGRTRKNVENGNAISQYFKKADVEVTEDNPTVQQALEQEADEYEANPTALGDQDLVATQQPSLVTGGNMRTYQLEGLEWLKTLWMNGLCGILADEMGLGKTIQAISMIAFLKENKVPGPYLIAAPLSTVSNWVDEFKRWTPGIDVVLYHGTKNERAAIRQKNMKLKNQGDLDFPVVCTSYEVCMNDRKFLTNYKWRYIVVVCSGRLLLFYQFC